VPLINLFFAFSSVFHLAQQEVHFLQKMKQKESEKRKARHFQDEERKKKI
jgi:hypothetical protein